MNLRDSIAVLALVAHFGYFVASKIVTNQVRSQDVCDEEVFEASCPPTSVVIIKQAVYGHLRLSKCTSIDTGHFGCRKDALSIVGQRCNGQQSCRVDGEDDDLKALKPCARGLVVYLHVKYLCVNALPVDPCFPVAVGSSPSFITSISASIAPCKRDPLGSLQIYLKAKIGQRISLKSVNLKADNYSVISEVGYVLDEGEDEVKPIKVDSQKRTDQEVSVFESVSNEVTLALHSNHNQLFLIVFEASGCEDLNLPNSDFWMERSGDTASVGCTNSQRMWTLQCINGRWSGVIGNCSQEVTVRVDALQLEPEIALALPKDIVLMLIVGLTVIVALMIVTTGYVCYKKYYQQHLRMQATPPADYEPSYNNTLTRTVRRPPESAHHPLLVPSTLTRPGAGSNVAAPTSQTEVPIWEHPLPIPPEMHDIYNTNTLRTLRNGTVRKESVNSAMLINPEAI